LSADRGIIRRVRSAWREMRRAIRDDHAMLRHYDAKYSPGLREDAALAHDLVTRVGFQMLAACRVMRFCVDAGIPVAPRVASRLIRHVYGSDIHWETQLAPGVVFVHGMGLALSRAARVEQGAILSQNVTLGMGIDPVTRRVGAPVVERDAQVGAGTTVVGPVTIGARSKVTANCFVRASVPADSLVEAPPPIVSARARSGARPHTEVDS